MLKKHAGYFHEDVRLQAMIAFLRKSIDPTSHCLLCSSVPFLCTLPSVHCFQCFIVIEAQASAGTFAGVVAHEVISLNVGNSDFRSRFFADVLTATLAAFPTRDNVSSSDSG